VSGFRKNIASQPATPAWLSKLVKGEAGYERVLEASYTSKYFTDPDIHAATGRTIWIFAKKGH
jgi:hypothetical protein